MLSALPSSPSQALQEGGGREGGYLGKSPPGSRLFLLFFPLNDAGRERQERKIERDPDIEEFGAARIYRALEKKRGKRKKGEEGERSPDILSPPSFS